jgi:hypothetical protein
VMSNAGADGSCGSKFKLCFPVLQVYLSWHVIMQVCMAHRLCCAPATGYILQYSVTVVIHRGSH